MITLMLAKLLNELSDNDRKLLLYAFEHGLSQLVKLPDGLYIGVNVQMQDVKEMKGAWCYGSL